MKNFTRYLWGMLLIAAGVLFALNLAKVISFDIWTVIIPVIILTVGVTIILGDRRNITGYIFIALGAVLLARKIFNWDISYKYIFAGLLVVIGAFIIFASKRKSADINKTRVREYVLFGGKTDRIISPDFEGCQSFCMFGAHEIDLTGLDISRDIEIYATVIFGGTTVFVPENVNVVLKTLPIFGGSENKTRNSHGNPYTVYINSTIIFGGIEIKN